ncbi:hypothetical protein HFD88_008582 [Aspergillus terreus]|nr:hypothetical protein HFD88_008582 [Aspergillus terreus]
MTITLPKMGNPLVVAVAKGAKAESPAEKYNHLEELVEAVIPYPCAFARFAIGGKKIVTATCPNEEGLFTDLAVVENDSASIVANDSAVENDPGPANDNSASL